MTLIQNPYYGGDLEFSPTNVEIIGTIKVKEDSEEILASLSRRKI